MPMNRQNLKMIALVAIFILSATAYFYQQGKPALEGWDNELTFSYPEYASGGADGSLHVIDNAKRRVTVLNKNNEIITQLRGGSRERGAFFYAIEIAPDPTNGHFYLLNNVLDDDGYHLVREEIMQFSRSGEMLGVVHQREYTEKDRSPSLIQRGRIGGMKFQNGQLHWFIVDDNGITPQHLTIGNDAPESGATLPFPDAAMSLARIHLHPKSGWVQTLKNGRIERIYAEGERYQKQTIFIAPQDNFSIVPWGVSVSTTGQVYFIDLVNRAIRHVQGADQAPMMFNHDLLSTARPDTASFDYYRLTITPNDDLITTNDEAVVQWSEQGELKNYIISAPYQQQLVMMKYGHWAVTALLIISSLILLFVVGRYLIALSPQIFYMSMATVGAVGLSAFVVYSIVMPSLIKEYESVLFEKISYMLQQAPKTVDGELFAEIDGIGDFNSDAYQQLRESFMATVNYNRDPWNKSSYFAIYRVIDEQLFGFMYLNGAISMMHPFDWIGYDGVYDMAIEGQIATEMTKDITGEWLYGVSPIYNKQGELVALFETGTDLYAFSLAEQRLRHSILLQVGTMLVILILVMIELIFLYQTLQKRHQLRLQSASGGNVVLGNYSDVEMARTLNFLYTFAISMSLAFIPLNMAKFYTEVPGFSKEFLLALPISLEMLFFGLATLMAGVFVRALGWRTVFIASIGISIGGLIFSGLAWDMVTFCIARAGTGLGSGIGYIAIRAFINQEQRTEPRSQGYSHFYAGMVAGVNAGVVLGATIADASDFSTTFYAAAAILVLCLLFYFTTLTSTPYMAKRSEGLVTSHKDAFIKIFSNYRIWTLFICLILPTYLAGTFLTYYLPLFAESEGLSTADIGRLFILNGLFIIYFGPPLSRVLRRRWGDYKTQIIGSVCWASSLMIFAFTGTLWGAIITLIIMGITEGYCAVAQNEYFLNLAAENKVDEDSATSYFELFGKVGETLGPIGFSIALMFGQSLGMLGLGVAILVITVPAIFLLGPLKRSQASSAA